MRLAIIGAGNVGGSLGGRWATKGHEVVFGVRDPGSKKVKSLLRAIGPSARAASVEDAAEAANVVVLAVPWNVAADVLQAAGDLSGKVLVDCTNPLEPGLTGLSVGHTTSAPEAMAPWLGSAAPRLEAMTAGALT